MRMKKKLIAILAALCLTAACAAFFAACGEGETVKTEYPYYTLTLNESGDGLILDVPYASKLPSGAISVPAASYYYIGNDGVYKEHDSAMIVTEIAEDAFKGIGTLTSVMLPSQVKTIGSGAFADCKALETVTLSDNVIAVPDNAFDGCTALKEVIGGTISSVGKYAFASCLTLRKLSFGFGENMSVGDRAFFYTNSISSLDMTKATSVGASAFEGWISSQKIVTGSTAGWSDEWRNGCHATLA